MLNYHDELFLCYLYVISTSKAMTYNILVSCPLKYHLPMRVGGYYLLCYYILCCTKPAFLTARAWPFSIDFNDNNFGCGTKNACGRGTGNYQLYYKSWPKGRNLQAWRVHVGCCDLQSLSLLCIYSTHYHRAGNSTWYKISWFLWMDQLPQM